MSSVCHESDPGQETILDMKILLGALKKDCSDLDLSGSIICNVPHKRDQVPLGTKIFKK